jgi:hypothetical protein
MSITDFSCKHCGQTRSISTRRVVTATFLRCDACFAISSLSLGQRLELINAASPERVCARPTPRPQHAASA